VIRVERSLLAHKLRTGRDGNDLVFGRSASAPFTPGAARATDVMLARLSLARAWAHTARGLGFQEQAAGKKGRVIVAASTVAIVAIAVVIVVALIALIYIVPRGGRRRRPKL
jgi:hypothetical protein